MVEWPRRSVRDLCSLIVDCVNRTAPVLDHPTPYRMIRTTNVKDGRIDLVGCRYVDEATFERWTRRARVLDGDVILTREAPIGEVGYINGLGHVFLGQRIMQYRPDPKKVVPRYLYYAFRSPDLQHQFGTHEGSGSVVSHIRVADCHTFEIPTPPLAHQETVAELLGSIDDKIELNRRMNETLEGMAQAIFRDWFVDFGPVRRKQAGATDAVEIMGGVTLDPAQAAELATLFPAALDDAGLPRGWSAIPILDTARLISGGTPKTDRQDYWNGPIPWASAKDVSQCGETYLLATERTITAAGLRNSSTKIVPMYSTVVVARGATTGRFCMFGGDLAMNQTCYALESRWGTPFWLHCAFADCVTGLIQSAHGSVFDTITTSTFERTPVVAPAKEVAQAFEQLVAPIFLKILSSLRENRTLAETRDYLLPRLMSGSVRVEPDHTAGRDLQTG